MKTVLILEDDPQLGAHWQAALERRGHRVICETMGEEAIAVLGETAVDLVITDMLIRDEHGDISRKGGLSLISHIRLRMTERPKILAVTGSSETLALHRHAAALRADVVLRKPVSAKTLVTEAERLLDSPPG